MDDYDTDPWEMEIMHNMYMNIIGLESINIFGE